MVPESRFQRLYNIADAVSLQRYKKTDVYLPRFLLGGPEDFEDYLKKGYITRIDYAEILKLGEILGDKNKKSLRPLQVQTYHNLVYSDADFKDITKSYYFLLDGILFEDGGVIRHPSVEEKDGKINFVGEKQKVSINKIDIVQTLVQAGLMEESEKKVASDSINFDSDGRSCIRSSWFGGGHCVYYCGAVTTSRSFFGIAAYEEFDERITKGISDIPVAGAVIDNLGQK